MLLEISALRPVAGRSANVGHPQLPLCLKVAEPVGKDLINVLRAKVAMTLSRDFKSAIIT